jgi:pimeloyl-ACP methyl ester carboxylesterase
MRFPGIGVVKPFLLDECRSPALCDGEVGLRGFERLLLLRKMWARSEEIDHAAGSELVVIMILHVVTNFISSPNNGRSGIGKRDGADRYRKGGVMSEAINRGRRRFFGTAAMAVVGAQLGMTAPADASPRPSTKVVRDMANRAESAQASATVVLVHGAWAEGSSWAHVITPLQSRGLRTIAAPIPLTSLSDDAAALERALERTDGPVVLVAHAYAGAVIGASTNERVQSLVFISALSPDEGETVAEVFYRDKASPEAPKLAPDSHGLLWMPDDRFGAAWCQHARLEEAALLAATQRPIAVAAIQEKAPKPAWKSKPSWYLVAEEDRMINPATQLFLARRMGARIRSEKVDHASLITAPRLVVGMILEAVASLTPNSARQHGRPVTERTTK